MLTGILAGRCLRKYNLVGIQGLITLLIWLLLFLLGIEVGDNDKIINGLARLGVEAVVMSLAATLGSVVLAWGLWHMLYNRSGHTNTKRSEALTLKDTARNMKGSLIIVAFFALGCIIGVNKWLPLSLEEINVSFYALCSLMFCVGVSIGNDPEVWTKFRSLKRGLVLLPATTIVGTLMGSALVSLCFAHRSLTDCLAVGSGFGYYSLSSIFITEYRGAELGTIALLANISREIFTLLAAPLLVRWFGNLAPIAAGGATTMDTTLPVITRTSGEQFVIVSLFHGFIVDFSVPFLVALFCSL